jgi:glutathione S-transferase
MERYRLVEWLAFISSEIHKNFSPMFRDDAPEETKQYVRKVLGTRLDYLNRTIGNRPFLMGEQFTVADAYLFTVLGWGRYLNFGIDKWPQLQRHMERVGERPQVIEALKAEGLVK